MAIARVTIEVEYEVRDANTAPIALNRLKNDLHHSLEIGTARNVPTGVTKGSVKINVTSKTIDGKSMP